MRAAKVVHIGKGQELGLELSLAQDVNTPPVGMITLFKDLRGEYVVMDSVGVIRPVTAEDWKDMAIGATNALKALEFLT